MPSAITAMPEQQFSYPPLGEMLETHPYALPEQRAFHQLANERDYTHDEHEHEHLADGPPRYATPPPNAEYQLHATMASELQAALDPKNETPTEEAGRSKAVPKPDRPVMKDDNGRYVCNWPGCDEAVKDFGRKCEWSKHMDKHDRPYKCPVPGCAKLPGFTYSGGLLRHEREVHHKHGGPRKQLNCPHMNCKRHHGKGFSRQENLNEHLRRVHTGTDGAEIIGTEESEGEGGKRKREGDEEVREELKRIKTENEDLKRQGEEMKRQSEEMMRQIRALQEQAGAMAQQQMEAHAQQQAQQATRMPAASMM
ncbi:hypothetical protein V493_08133 [Pseudogymnoascus sp. VKM F-4281 (FW-2241)]|nr:hypothetical protein V493_08133 [Pseudogymnoascus sp. VKM F-4281 (FW-2241)]